MSTHAAANGNISFFFYGSYSMYMYISLASLVVQRLKRLPTTQHSWVLSLGREHTLEKEMATHSSILAGRFPWMEERGRLQSTGSQRVGHNWATSLSLSCISHLYPLICSGILRLLPYLQFSSVQFSCSVMSDSLQPHELQHTRPPCLSPTPGDHSLMSIESVMPSSHLILCRPLLLLPPIPPSIRVFSSESTLHMRWPK